MLTLTILLTATLVLLLFGAFTNNACATNRLTALAAVLAAVPLVLQPTTGALFSTTHGPLLLLTPMANFIWLALLILTPLALALNPIAKNAYCPTAKPEYPILVLLSVTGMLILTASHDWLAFYVGLELMSFPLYILCAFNRKDAASSESGLKYFVLGALASGLFLYGASLFYATTGTTNFTAAFTTVTHLGAQPLAAVGTALILVAVLFKLSAAPFHVWTPDVYQGAPTSTTALLGSLPKLAMLAILLRILHLPLADVAGLWQPALAVVAVVSMVLGSVVAVVQSNLKRLLAWSTIGNVGFMLVGVVAATPAASAGVLFYAVVYVLNTLGLFAILTVLEQNSVHQASKAQKSTVIPVRGGVGSPQAGRGPHHEPGQHAITIQDLHGLIKRSPLLTAALIIHLFSLAGVPPLAGFMGKLNAFLPAVQSGHTVLVLIAVAASVVALFYSLNLIKYAVFTEAPTHNEHRKPNAETPTTLHLVIAFTTLVTLALGLFPQPLLAHLQTLTLALF